MVDIRRRVDDEYDFRLECATLAAGVQVTRVTFDPAGGTPSRVRRWKSPKGSTLKARKGDGGVDAEIPRQ